VNAPIGLSSAVCKFTCKCEEAFEACRNKDHPCYVQVFFVNSLLLFCIMTKSSQGVEVHQYRSFGRNTQKACQCMLAHSTRV